MLYNLLNLIVQSHEWERVSRKKGKLTLSNHLFDSDKKYLMNCILCWWKSQLNKEERARVKVFLLLKQQKNLEQ